VQRAHPDSPGSREATLCGHHGVSQHCQPASAAGPRLSRWGIRDDTLPVSARNHPPTSIRVPRRATARRAAVDSAQISQLQHRHRRHGPDRCPLRLVRCPASDLGRCRADDSDALRIGRLARDACWGRGDRRAPRTQSAGRAPRTGCCCCCCCCCCWGDGGGAQPERPKPVPHPQRGGGRRGARFGPVCRS
jgi:hypothetical protein